MNENINLCEILKGHEGETFYSPCWGYMELTNVSNYVLYFDDTFKINAQGKINDRGECVIFPSKDQRDWNKWDKENNPKVPKTWSELIKVKNIFTMSCDVCSDKGIDKSKTFTNTPIEKSALALLKIHQLIEVGYGGNIPIMEKINGNNNYWDIDFDTSVNFYANTPAINSSHIAFHTKKQAYEFLSYPENIQLLKDYFMI